MSAFDQCPMSFKLQYIDKVAQEDNAFAEYGTLCHTLLEEYAKGELSKEQLVQEYEKRYYTAVVHNFPPYPKGYAQRAYNEAYQYFQGFNGFGNEFEILSIEEKFETRIGGYLFSGIADLVLKDVQTGAIKVIDHKTKSVASMKKEFDQYRKQLYTYARYVYEKFGVYPESMAFNMIKTGEMIEIPFIKSEYDETMEWIVQTIESAILEFEWNVSSSPFFCQFICGVRKHCPAADSVTYKKNRG